MHIYVHICGSFDKSGAGVQAPNKRALLLRTPAERTPNSWKHRAAVGLFRTLWPLFDGISGTLNGIWGDAGTRPIEGAWRFAEVRLKGLRASSFGHFSNRAANAVG